MHVLLIVLTHLSGLASLTHWVKPGIAECYCLGTSLELIKSGVQHIVNYGSAKPSHFQIVY